jgi:hypothetical protein
MANSFSLSHLSQSPWFHLLGAPILWSVHFLISYAWVEYACRMRLLVLDSTMLGLTLLSWSILLLTLIAVLATVYVGWSAYRSSRRISESKKTNELESWGVESRRFMALSGILLSALFSLVILLSGLPALVLGPCAE